MTNLSKKYYWGAGDVVLFVYDGYYWNIVDSGALTKAGAAQATADAAMPAAGGQFTGNVSFASGKTLTVNTPTEAAHAANKDYVDTAISDINTDIKDLGDRFDEYMPLAGGEFSGDVRFATGEYLTVNDPRADADGISHADDAANRGYVDIAKTNAETTAKNYTDTRETAILGQENNANFNGTVKGAYAAANAAQTTANNAMPKSGGQFTGDVSFKSGEYLTVNAPRSGDTGKSDAATRLYVDTAQANAEATASGYVSAAKSTILGKDGTNDFNGTVKGAYDAASAAAGAAEDAMDEAEKKAPINHASTATTYGAGNSTNYGHVKLSDATNSTSDASSGVAASAKAVNTLRTDLIGTSSSASSTSTIYGAKKYTDEKVAALATVVEDLGDDIGNLSNIMNFLGTTTTTLADGGTTNPIKINNEDVSAVKGDVVVNGNKEFVFDGSKWAEIGDVSAQAAAITNLESRVTDTEDAIGALQDVSDDHEQRIDDLETWKGTHATEYSLLNVRVGTLEGNVGSTNDDASTNASTTGTAFARIKKNASDISAHNTRISTLESWKTSHSSEYTALANRVTALETWKGTHSTQYTNLSNTVSANSDAIDALTLVLTWGSF